MMDCDDGDDTGRDDGDDVTGATCCSGCGVIAGDVVDGEVERIRCNSAIISLDFPLALMPWVFARA